MGKRRAKKRNPLLQGCAVVVVFIGLSIYGALNRQPSTSNQQRVATVAATAMESSAEEVAGEFTPDPREYMAMRPETYTAHNPIYVYACPSRECEEVGEVDEGGSVTVTGAINGEEIDAQNVLWYEIEWADRRAYVYSNGVGIAVAAQPTARAPRQPLAYDFDVYSEILDFQLRAHSEITVQPVGITDRRNEDADRTVMIHYTNSAEREITDEWLEIFDAIGIALNIADLDLDAVTLLIHLDADEDIIVGRVTAQVPDVLTWYADEITRDQFLARLEIVNLIATREARATTRPAIVTVAPGGGVSQPVATSAPEFICPSNCDGAVSMGLSAEQAAACGLDRDGDGVACYGD